MTDTTGLSVHDIMLGQSDMPRALILAPIRRVRKLLASQAREPKSDTRWDSLTEDWPDLKAWENSAGGLGAQHGRDQIPDGSAILCDVTPEGRPAINAGKISCIVEAPHDNPIHLFRFRDRVARAGIALRSSRRGSQSVDITSDELVVLGVYDLARRVAISIEDVPSYKAWTGERVTEFLGRVLQTPNVDQETIREMMMEGGEGIVAPPLFYQLLSGQVVVQEKRGGPMVVIDHDDPDLMVLLRRAGVIKEHVYRLTGRIPSPKEWGGPLKSRRKM